MELNFTKQEGVWAAEFKVTTDFNLHIEGVKEGNVRIYQRSTADGKYAYVRSATPYPSFGYVYDFDFSALVYPKFIRIECPNKPTKAEVTSLGEVEQVKSIPTYNFVVPCEEQDDIFDGKYLEGRLDGDFSAIYNELVECAKANGEYIEDQDNGYKIWRNGDCSELVDITVNGTKMTGFDYVEFTSGEKYIQYETDGPFTPSVDSSGVLYPSYITYQTPIE